MPDRFECAALLLKMRQQIEDGVVRFEISRFKKQIVFRGGLVAWAESNAPEEHLARILLASKRLDRNQFTEVIRLMKAGKASDEAILEASDVGIEELRSAALRQAIQVTGSLLPLSGSKVTTYSGKGILRRRIEVGLPLPELLVAAAREAAGSRCPAASPPLGLSGRTIVRAPAQSAGLLRMPLSREESFAYGLVDAPTPVSAVLEVIPARGENPADVIRCLLLLGLLEFHHVGPAAKSAAEAEPDSRCAVEPLLQKFESADCYEILSVPADASEDQIRDAYHALARQYHPDRYQGEQVADEMRRAVERLFTHITGAYATLSNPASRRSYDEHRSRKASPVDAALKARSTLDPEKEKMAEVLYRAGRTALAASDFAKAVTQLKECVWLMPGVARYRRWLGAAQSEVPGFRKQAELHLLKSIELDNMAAESHVLLGKLYLKVNLPRKAELQFLEALKWEPENAEVQALLAQTALQENRR